MSVSAVRVPDDGGDEMVCAKIKDVLLPNFDHDVLSKLDSVTLRSDDIMLLTYPKSGTHWVWEIVRLLLAGKLDDDNVSKATAMMEMVPETTYANLPSPRILNTHVPPKLLPKGVFEKKLKIIYVIRNLKDVAVSGYNFYRNVPETEYSGKWENFFRPYVQGKFNYGSWFDYTKTWEEIKKDNPELPVLTLFYEDLKEDPVREAKKMRDFLQVERSDAFLKDVCDHCDFDNLKQRKETFVPAQKLGIYRKGHVGDWKNWLTVAQNEWFDEIYKERMAGVELNIRFTLEK